MYESLTSKKITKRARVPVSLLAQASQESRFKKTLKNTKQLKDGEGEGEGWAGVWEKKPSVCS
jgi:hypothetical protein